MLADDLARQVKNGKNAPWDSDARCILAQWVHNHAATIEAALRWAETMDREPSVLEPDSETVREFDEWRNETRAAKRAYRAAREKEGA